MPFINEIIHLLPLAYRMREYIKSCNKKKELPIFDLDVNSLSPPQPGPYSGCPLGGLGCGSIGRGGRGDFNRFNLIGSGKYKHGIIESDLFCVRIKRGEVIDSVVLSFLSPDGNSTSSTPSSSNPFSIITEENNLFSPNFSMSSTSSSSTSTPFKPPVNTNWINSSTSTSIPSNISHISLLNSWNWTLDPKNVLYKARYPLAKHEYILEKVGCRLIIWQVSPILPHNYVESSLPCGSFIIEIEDLREEELDGEEEEKVEVSMMFVFENGINNDEISLPHELFKTSESKNKEKNNREPEQEEILGVYMPHINIKKVYQDNIEKTYPMNNSFSISIRNEKNNNEKQEEVELSYCREFISSIEKKSSVLNKLSSLFLNSSNLLTQEEAAALDFNNLLWETFTSTGSLSLSPSSPSPISTPSSPSSDPSLSSCSLSSPSPSSSSSSMSSCPLARKFLEENKKNIEQDIENIFEEKTRYRISSALCGKKTIKFKKRGKSSSSSNSSYSFNSSSSSLSLFTFSLGWAYPTVIFGEDKLYQRYYTRFLGDSVQASISLALLSSLRSSSWKRSIFAWQEDIIKELLEDEENLGILSPSYSLMSSTQFNDSSSHIYHMLFNELYFLVDGGSLWLNTENGTNLTSSTEDFFFTSNYYDDLLSLSSTSLSSYFSSLFVSSTILGDQKQYGQYLYLEGHEYLMYNTYDVHFYASFSLLKLFPHLEFSVQRDFGEAVMVFDDEKRLLISGESNKEQKRQIISDLSSTSSTSYPTFSAPPYNICFDQSLLGISFDKIYFYEKYLPKSFLSSFFQKENFEILRKKQGKVPHDLGSPSGVPYRKLNAYNFQDVSLWKDLPSKFILMTQRDVKAIENWTMRKKRNKNENFSTESYVEDFSSSDILGYVEQLFAVCERVYLQTFIDSIIPLWNLSPDHYAEYLSSIERKENNNEFSSFISVYDAISAGFYYLNNPKKFKLIQKKYLSSLPQEVQENLKPSFSLNNEDDSQENENDIEKEKEDREDNVFSSNISFLVRNSGFPDQTYDIWTAHGIHAYCGGLWIASTSAMEEMSNKLKEMYENKLNNDEHEIKEKINYFSKINKLFSQISTITRQEYVNSLWNGAYLSYDSSQKSSHSLSIMSDMLCGHYFARVSGLKGVLVDKEKLHSCLRTIFYQNVLNFSLSKHNDERNSNFRRETKNEDNEQKKGKRRGNDGNILLKGAVNGMNPSKDFFSLYKSLPYDPIDYLTKKFGDTSSTSFNNSFLSSMSSIDNSCLQSREVWAGTTYLLSSLFLLEAKERKLEEEKELNERNSPSTSTLLSSSSLYQMSLITSRGIHDAAWRTAGYQFATPEAFEDDLKYRSLGYMRPLSIWSRVFPLEFEK